MFGFGKQTQRKDFAKYLSVITALFLIGPIASMLGLVNIGQVSLFGYITIYTVLGLANALVFVWYMTREL